MACGKIGERSGLPCLKRDSDHDGKCRYRYFPKPAPDQSSRATPIPAGGLPRSALAALIRYQKSDLCQEGDQMFYTIIRRLSD